MSDLVSSAMDVLPTEERPASAVISQARKWLRVLRDTLSKQRLPWIDPHVASNPSEVVFEWRIKEKGLTVYVSETSVEFIRSWGTSITEEMDDGVVETKEAMLIVWAWLLV